MRRETQGWEGNERGGLRERGRGLIFLNRLLRRGLGAFGRVGREEYASSSEEQEQPEY